MTAQTQTRPPRGFVLVLAGLAVGIAIVVFGAGSWAGTYTSNVRIASITIAPLGVLIWLAIALVQPVRRPASQLLVAFSGAFLAFAISALFAANQRFALDYLGYAVLLFALYLLLVQLWSIPAIAHNLTVILTILCAGTGVVFIAVIVSTWIDLWSTIGRFVAPPLRLTYEGLWTGTPNVLAAFQVLLATVAVPRLWAGGRRSRQLAVALTVLVLLDVFLSASRGAWLALALATPVTGLAWWLSRPAGSRMPRGIRMPGRAVGAAAGAAVVVLGLAAVVAGPGFLARISNGGADLRGSFLAASWRMFMSNPLTGIGPGAWTPARIRFTDASEIDYYIPHAHNLPAQVLAEFGLVGMVAGVVVVASLVWMVLRAIRSSDPALRLAGLAALFACVYIVGQQLVDEFIQQPAILFAIGLPIARLDSLLTFPSAAPTANAKGRLLTLVLLGVVFIGAAAALVPERAAIPYERGVTAANSGQWQDASRLADEAANLDPRLSPYQLLRGLSAAQLGDLASARDAFAQAAALDDYPASWLDLAAVQLRMGDPQAEASLDRAVRLGRQQPEIAVPAAELYLELDDAAKAREMLAAAFAVSPSLASDPTWTTGKWPIIATGAVDDAIAASPPWTALMLALESGRSDAARQLVPAVEPSERALAEATVAAWGGDEAAFAALHRMALADPMDETTVGLCRRVARVHDPAGDAAGWTCDGGWWFGVYPIVRVGDQPSSASIPGPAAYPHALYAYRRPGPTDVLVPWLLHLFAAIA